MKRHEIEGHSLDVRAFIVAERGATSLVELRKVRAKLAALWEENPPTSQLYQLVSQLPLLFNWLSVSSTVNR